MADAAGLVDGHCESPYWYQPNPKEFGDSSSLAAVTDSGPNEGYWYLTQVRYRRHRVGTTASGAAAVSSIRHPVPNASATCRKALGIGSKDAAHANCGIGISIGVG